MIEFKAGATSKTIYVFIGDSASTTGGGKTGLVFNTASLKAYYVRSKAAAVAITLATQTVTGAWSSGGFVEVDATNCPGLYRLDMPDAAIAAGVDRCIVQMSGASGMVSVVQRIILRVYDPEDAVRLGLTALPNAAAGANGGLPVLSSSATTLAYTVSTVTTVTNQLTAAQIATGVWQDTTAGDFTTALSVGKSIMNGVSLGTGLTVARCTLTDTLTTYTGNTVQTGDSFARIGAAGAGLTAIGDTRMANLDATVSSRLATSGYTAPPSAATIATTVLTTQMTESYRSAGTAPTLAQAAFELIAGVLDHSISGTTKTLRKIDGTTAKTYTLDSSTAPTSITEAT